MISFARIFSSYFILLAVVFTGCATSSSYSISTPGTIPSGFSSWNIAESHYFPEVDRTRGTGLRHEQAKIKYLLGHTGETPLFRFDRNGHVFDAKTTAKHLKKKYKERYREITTASMFIEEIATRSSESGRPYYALNDANQAFRTDDLLKHELRRLENYLRQHP